MNQRTQLNDWDKAEKSEHEDVPQWPPPPSLKKLREREREERIIVHTTNIGGELQ